MDAQVEISCGRLQGVHRKGVFQFAGVPYAEDPVGPLRFRPPVPREPWADVRDATRPAAIAPQLASRLSAVMGDFAATQSEACLSLTISTPGMDARKRPVIVWLHGGGFSSGAGGLAWYDGCELARLGDVVVVGVNYRLGVLGFLVAEGVSEGNLGLLDQALALSFIRKNIAAFGGDPEQLTLMGQSAGGNSIAALFAGNQDMAGVRRVILQSAAFGMAPQAERTALASGHAFLRAVGLEPRMENLRARLEALPVARILEAQAEVARSLARYGNTEAPFQLFLNPRLFPSPAFHLSAADAMKGIDVLIGVTADEAHAFLMQDPRTQVVGFDEVLRHARDIYGEQGVDRLLRIRAEHAGEYAGLQFSRLISDEVFGHPSQAFARRADRGGNKVYFYVFGWQPEVSPFKSCHCLELPFVFGLSDAWMHAPMLGGTDGERLAEISHPVQAAWLAFVRTGEPGTDLLPPWNRFTDSVSAVMHLSEAPYLQTEEHAFP